PPQSRFRPRAKPKPKSGLAGMLSALPISGDAVKKAASGGGKGKPAAALLVAGAGALLGGRQLRNKRKDAGSPPADTPYFPPTPAPAVTPGSAAKPAGGTSAPVAAVPPVEPTI